MKKPHQTFIRHIPFGKPYRGKRPVDAASYDNAVISGTSDWPRVENECLFKATFVLGPAKFADRKFLGPDLDNLTKRLFDCLKSTIFASPADDSFVVAMEISKTRVDNDDDSGVFIEVVPLHTIRK